MNSTNNGAATRRPQEPSKREVAFYVRAKTGPGSRDWSPIGVAFARKNGEPGFTIKLNTLPISGWNGSMVLVPPFVEEDEAIEEDHVEPAAAPRGSRRRPAEAELPIGG
jgi:hypothetical protein